MLCVLVGFCALAAPALAATTGQRNVTVCTAQYEGFDFFVDGFAVPTTDAGWPVVLQAEDLEGPNAKLRGFDVDLRALLFAPERLNMKQTVLVHKDMSSALYAVRTEQCDMTHAPATISPYRESCLPSCPLVKPGQSPVTNNTCCVDFSHQMLVTGVSLMLHKEDSVGDSQSVVLETLFSRSSAEALLLLFLLVIIAGHIFWVVERTSDGSSDIDITYRKGSVDGVWWAMVTATTVGYGDINPKRPLGKVFSVCWMVVGLCVTGLVLGILASALTAAKLVEPITGLDQMRGKSVCTSNFYSSLITSDSGVVFVEGNFASCKARLLDPSDPVAALATDAPVIQYDLKHNGGGEAGLVMSPIFHTVSLGMAFPERANVTGDTLISEVNPTLLGLMKDTSLYDELQAPWFGAAPRTDDPAAEEWNLAVVIPSLVAIFLFVGVQVAMWFMARKEQLQNGGIKPKHAAAAAASASSDDLAAAPGTLSVVNPMVSGAPGGGVEMTPRAGKGAGESAAAGEPAAARAADVMALRREVQAVRAAMTGLQSDVTRILEALGSRV